MVGRGVHSGIQGVYPQRVSRVSRESIQMGIPFESRSQLIMVTRRLVGLKKRMEIALRRFPFDGFIYALEPLDLEASMPLLSHFKSKGSLRSRCVKSKYISNVYTFSRFENFSTPGSPRRLYLRKLSKALN